jgi:hypothetical protein
VTHVTGFVDLYRVKVKTKAHRMGQLKTTNKTTKERK